MLSLSARDKLRTVLIRDDRDEIAQELLRYGDANGDGWAAVIDTQSMYRNVRRQRYGSSRRSTRPALRETSRAIGCVAMCDSHGDWDEAFYKEVEAWLPYKVVRPNEMLHPYEMDADLAALITRSLRWLGDFDQGVAKWMHVGVSGAWNLRRPSRISYRFAVGIRLASSLNQAR